MLRKQFLIVCVGWSLVLQLLGCSSTASESIATRDARRSLRQQLAEIIESDGDNENDALRAEKRGSHFWGWVSDETLVKMYPPPVELYRLLLSGREHLVPGTKLIAEDTSEDPLIKDVAGGIYGYFDIEWVLRDLAQAQYPTLESRRNLNQKLHSLLPWMPRTWDLHSDWTDEWLRSSLSPDVDFDEFILSKFDQIMRPDLDEKDYGLRDRDYRLVFWFNRLNDQDLSGYLEAHDAELGQFRESLIATKGIDPLTAFDLGSASSAERRSITSRVFDARDSRRCVDLLELVWPSFGRRKEPTEVVGGPNWKSRVCDWYWTNRDRFRFSASRQQFQLTE